MTAVTPAEAVEDGSFQARVLPCFGAEIASDKIERRVRELK
jgi:hypothetical protein